MIAQYHRKFGFTAIIVSHEIPDVYFISNRILALYNKGIVFQGTPEELEKFDHPFNDEVIHSLEALQKELTGLYSKRQFKVMNQAQLSQKNLRETYSVAVFSLEELNTIIKELGHDAAQGALRCLGLYIDKHFSAIGGFSTRRNSNEVVTMLPYSNLTEANMLLNDFIKDFQIHGTHEILSVAQKHLTAGKSVEFTVLAGLAEGQPATDIDSVIALAKSQQKEIGRLNCAAEE
jgi:ABC-type transport system involved in resistance to organic solvents, ATPase component